MMLRFKSWDGLNACHALAIHGHLSELRTFLQKYRDPDHVEVATSITELLQLVLVGAGYPGVEDVGDRGELVRLLIHYGADGAFCFEGDGEDSTFLHFVRHPGEAAALLDDGADIDAVFMISGSTPLMFATHPVANRSDGALVRFLWRCGADITLKNYDGEDAEAAARRYNNSEAADFLRDMKAPGESYKNYEKYLRAPRVELVRLRSLCDRGRAAPPSPSSAKLRTISAETFVLQRMFGAPSKDRLPNEVFWHIISYWRTSRDD